MTLEEHKVQVVGVLYSQGQQYDMLSLNPQKHFSDMSIFLREHVFVFECVVEGMAQSVIVGRSGFCIVPLLSPVERTAQYLVEQDDEPTKELQILGNFLDYLPKS